MEPLCDFEGAVAEPFGYRRDRLCALIARERGREANDVECWVAANALIGVHRALIGYALRQTLAGVVNRRIARNLRTHGKRALAALEHGLG